MQFPLFDMGLSKQSSDEARRPWDARPNMLYVLLKPSTDLASAVRKLPEAASNRPPELLHTMIQPVGDRSWITDSDIEATRQALSQVRYAPFLMLFDRIQAGNTMALYGGSQNCAAQDFRIAILDALFSHFLKLPSYHLDPHMTLNYRAGARGRLLEQPIAWLIEEFLLVESVHGETRHIEWGRWRLRDD